MTFADGVTTGGQGGGFFVIHCHAGKGFADLLGGFGRVWLPVDTFGVHIDQAHLNRGKRIGHG